MQDNHDFKEAMSLIPTCVGVVWINQNQTHKLGCTISSFVSVSVANDNEIVAFVLRSDSRTAQIIKETNELNVSILSENQFEIAGIFAAGLTIKQLNKSLEVFPEWNKSSICEFSLKIEKEIEISQSTIFIAKVESFLYRQDIKPLVYSSRKYI